jgi:hypothetical protein
MTDLGTLRRALQTPVRPDDGAPGFLDIDEIIVKGRRLRRRRRVTVAGASAALAAAVVTAVAGVGQPGQGSHPSQASVPLAPRPSVTASHGPARPSPAPTASPAAPVGKVIVSGITGPAGALVFYAVKIGLASLPGTKFGIMAGYRDTAGRLSAAVETNETAGPGTTAGFHAVEAPMQAGSPSTAIPEFGYYAGPAVTITGTMGGHKVRAATARWSQNRSIVIFWFPATAGPAATAVQNLAAYDQAGHLLPAGHAAGQATGRG